MATCCEQNMLLKDILLTSFCIKELVLFLDTHPDDSKCLACYHEKCELYNQLTKKYTSMYGPITSRDVNNDNHFCWVNNPWPWEVNF